MRISMVLLKCSDLGEMGFCEKMGSKFHDVEFLTKDMKGE
jgi:hypothetical protein